MKTERIKESVAKCLDSLPSNVLLVATAKTRTPREVKDAIDANVKIIGIKLFGERAY